MAEIQIRILALNFYITKMFTGQQYFGKFERKYENYIKLINFAP